MWKYSTKNDYPIIILHDCCIENITIDGHNIVFDFDENGFWVSGNSKYNSDEKTLRTDKSEVQFTNCDFDFIRIYIYNTYRIFGKPFFTRRIELPLKKLSTLINSRKWQFEFIDELYAWHEAFFIGLLRSKSKPYHIECQIHFSYEDMLYCWNKVCEDRPW